MIWRVKTGERLSLASGVEVVEPRIEQQPGSGGNDEDEESPPAAPRQGVAVPPVATCFGPVAFSSDERLAAALSSPDTVALIDATSLRKVFSLSGHEAAVTWLAFSPDGSYLATASLDWTIKLWNTKTGALETTLKGHRQAVRAIRFSAKGKYLITIGDDTTKVWDLSYTASPLDKGAR
jgi:WD40 repeat protein